ncbi:ABC transporter permease [Chelatococcus reniformis]|uniref:ABC transporter permease n=1 Tax=Chelatococcus reniformis TaxID=1494448 RepID=A0A916TWV4_9HYPH|nr:SMP-30/gluconolactonase/LRE family protein [Chelatococcus reniformis]GGC48124.1 ABC transporter permease [Chelatococcus reniformis]
MSVAASPPPRSSVRDAVNDLRYRFSIKLFLSELLSKNWMEPIVPFLLMVALIGYFSATVPNYTSLDNTQQLLRLFAEIGLVSVAMGFVLISGGIDLSVGAIFAVTNLAALILFKSWEWPVWAVALGTLAVGAFIGLINGVLVGYLKARPFLTTLVTLIILRAGFDMVSEKYAPRFAVSDIESDVWDFLGGGTILGIPTNALALLVVLIIGHVYLSRSRYGWHIMAVGSSRKAARHAGIRVERVLLGTYVLSGLLCALAGLFYAARQNSAGSDTGQGWEMQALTAVVLGGISLAGGRGTVWRAAMGAVIVFLLINGFVRLGLEGYLTMAALGAILLVAVGFDVKWAKNRGKAIQKIYVNPTRLELKQAPSIARGSASPYAENDRLSQAEVIGLGQVEGPEDVILDRQDRLYTGTREGWILRFSGPNFEHREVFARMGGRPLGLAFDKDENLVCCNGGMGVYGVTPQGEIFKITDETNRTWGKLNDDSRLRLADDLDIAPDGKIYFSEATIRYEMHSWDMDGIEGRGNGRMICYDPATRTTRTIIKNQRFPNGVCVAHDGQSVLYVSTWLCRILRYWIAGPKKGQLETVVEQLPGYPDNLNRASDGGYWLALAGIRSPAYDLAMRKPDFRLRMVKEIPRDEWLYPGLNNGCVVKLDADCQPVETYWDPTGKLHPTITSMREHKGYLYIGGLENNRIGRIKLPGADPDWTGWESYWGNKQNSRVRPTSGSGISAVS